MLSVTDRVCQLRINHVFNIFHGHAPEYLCKNFNLNNNLTRGATNLNSLVWSGNTCNKNSFVYNAILDRNNLPINIKNISNKPAFKSAAKNYLKITTRNRELDDFSWLLNFMCIVIIYIFIFLFFRATFCA